MATALLTPSSLYHVLVELFLPSMRSAMFLRERPRRV